MKKIFPFEQYVRILQKSYQLLKIFKEISSKLEDCQKKFKSLSKAFQIKELKCSEETKSPKFNVADELFSSTISASFKTITSLIFFFSIFICWHKRIFLINATRQLKTVLFFALRVFSCAASTSLIFWRSLNSSVLSFFHSFSITQKSHFWLRRRYSL